MRLSTEKSLICNLDPRTKLFGTFVVATLAVLLGGAFPLALLLMLSLSPWAMIRPKRHKGKLLVAAFTTIFVGIVFSQAVFYNFQPKTPIFTLIPPSFPVVGRITSGVRIYREGIAYGAVQSMRVVACFSMGMMVAFTTEASDMVLALTKLGLPGTFAFMLSIALRFFPALSEEAARIAAAQKLRGVRTRGFLGRLCALRLLVFPLVLNSLRTARQMALAAETRAFSGERTPISELKFSAADWCVLSGLTAVLLAGVTAVLLGYGARIPGVSS